jgi:hypothetical protein
MVEAFGERYLRLDDPSTTRVVAGLDVANQVSVFDVPKRMVQSPFAHDTVI